jgi:rod shape-determining protein MreD
MMQASFLGVFAVFGVRADIIVPVLVLVMLSSGLPSALFYGIFTGFLQDILATATPGINTVLYLLLAVAITTLAHRLIIETLTQKIIIVLLAIVALSMARIAIFILLGKPVILISFLKVTFTSLIYTAVVLPVIIKLLKQFNDLRLWRFTQRLG